MTDSVCWSCGNEIDSSDLKCKNCGADLNVSNSLISKENENSPPNQTLNTKDDNSGPDETKKEDLKWLDNVTNEYNESNNEIPTVDDKDVIIPEVPDIDNLEIKKIDVSETETIEEEVKPFDTYTIKQKIIFFLPQWTYWSLVFILIGLAGITVTNPNYNPLNVQYLNDVSINPGSIIFGWISFLPMGFFLSYKLRKTQTEPRFIHGILFLIGQFIVLLLLTYIGVLILNPEILFEVVNPKYYILTTKLIYSITNFIICLITSGVVIFYAGLLFFYDKIFSYSSHSNIGEF